MVFLIRAGAVVWIILCVLTMGDGGRLAGGYRIASAMVMALVSGVGLFWLANALARKRRVAEIPEAMRMSKG